jgi:hypothetical protein
MYYEPGILQTFHLHPEEADTPSPSPANDGIGKQINVSAIATSHDNNAETHYFKSLQFLSEPI